MAKLTKLPGMNIISGFKGIIDFYVHDGIPCARAWPRSPGHTRAPAVMEAWKPFTWAASNWIHLTPEIQQAYNQMAVGTRLTGRDIFTKGFISAFYLRLE